MSAALRVGAERGEKWGGCNNNSTVLGFGEPFCTLWFTQISPKPGEARSKSTASTTIGSGKRTTSALQHSSDHL